MPTYYETLGLPLDASEGDIRAAYKKLALKHHPDRKGGNTEAFKAVNRSHEELIDPKARVKYDKTLTPTDKQAIEQQYKKILQEEQEKQEILQVFKEDHAKVIHNQGDYYKVLGLPNTANQSDVVEAGKYFKELFQGDKESSKIIQEAYTTLSDPEKRAKYDILVQENLEIKLFKEQYAVTTNDKMDYYQVLSVERNATPEQITEAYQQLNGVFEGDKEYKKLSQTIQAAYKELKDPETRQAYDNHLEQQESQARGATTSPVTVTAVEESQKKGREDGKKDHAAMLREGLTKMKDIGYAPGYGYSNKSQINNKGPQR